MKDLVLFFFFSPPYFSLSLFFFCLAKRTLGGSLDSNVPLSRKVAANRSILGGTRRKRLLRRRRFNLGIENKNCD